MQDWKDLELVNETENIKLQNDYLDKNHPEIYYYPCNTHGTIINCDCDNDDSKIKFYSLMIELAQNLIFRSEVEIKMYRTELNKLKEKNV